MEEEFVVGFMKDEPEGLTPIDVVMDVTGLTYDEVKSCCVVVAIPGTRCKISRNQTHTPLKQ